jgi:glutamate N-acetyltransferase/amino-acid N-acetyltransferase
MTAVRIAAGVGEGVATPDGFCATGVSAGIKAKGLDLALVVSDTPATCAALFTTNRAPAAPVLVSAEHLRKSGGVARAVVANSGCANACTGEFGVDAARATAAETARLVGCPTEQVLVASTGVIGVALPVNRICRVLPEAFRSIAPGQGGAAARAIMTTDPFPKEAAIRLFFGGGKVTIGGMAKGSGMIEPMLATMLAFVTTDAAVPQALLDSALRDAAHDTFNAITVDGETSTNDTVVALANGASGVSVTDSSYETFAAALRVVCQELALGIVRGGEGATKLITVSVTGAVDAVEARRAAKAIANSLLVKTAIHGGDPNWGRLIAVAGRAGVQFDPSRAAITMGPVVLFKDGRPYDGRASDAASYLKGRDIVVGVNLGVGDAESTVWTCDLSPEYVRINAEYRS